MKYLLTVIAAISLAAPTALAGSGVILRHQ